jgi:methyl-accepting chemotaxis protein
MSDATPTASPLSTPPPADRTRGDGLLGPSVRLMRSVRFRTKSTLISLIFVVPIAALAWSYFQQLADQRAFSTAERDGVEFARAGLPLLQASTALREASGSAAARATALRDDAAAFDALAPVQERLGAALGTTAAWQALRPLRDAARAAPTEESAATLDATARYVSGVLALLDAAFEGSNLILDPEALTFHLMAAGLLNGPRLIEHTSAAAVALAAALRPGSTLLPAAASEGLTLARARLDEVSTWSARAARADAAAGARAAPDGLVRAFTALEQSMLRALASDPPRGDPAALLAQARSVRETAAAWQTSVLETLDEALKARLAAMSRAQTGMAVLVSVTLALAAWLFLGFYRATRDAMHDLSWHLEAMAHGDLTHQPVPRGRDESTAVMHTLAEMQTSLQSIVGGVRGSAQQIVMSSSELRGAAQDLSSRTESTAASLQESAASMEEIAATVKLTAEHARQGAALADGNARDASRGEQVIDNVVQTMSEIQQSSEKIASIVSMIDGIAFQTNILALNAAVEAARAGEAGRGFAVVAGEVRELSQRSSRAAREIRELIESTVDRVSSGSKAVQGAGDAMRALLGHARRLNELTAAIADAAGQQDGGVSQVGNALQDLDRGAQQNAAMVEQTAAAAASLADEAARLQAAVGVFRVPETRG